MGPVGRHHVGAIDQEILHIHAIEVFDVAEDIFWYVEVFNSLTEPAEKAVRVNLSGCGIQYVVRFPVHG